MEKKRHRKRSYISRLEKKIMRQLRKEMVKSC